MAILSKLAHTAALGAGGLLWSGAMLRHGVFRLGMLHPPKQGLPLAFSAHVARGPLDNPCCGCCCSCFLLPLGLCSHMRPRCPVSHHVACLVSGKYGGREPLMQTRENTPVSPVQLGEGVVLVVLGLCSHLRPRCPVSHHTACLVSGKCGGREPLTQTRENIPVAAVHLDPGHCDTSATGWQWPRSRHDRPRHCRRGRRGCGKS